MIGKIAKAAAYTKAPRKAFFFLHPIKAAKLGIAYYVGKKIFGAKKKA